MVDQSKFVYWYCPFCDFDEVLPLNRKEVRYCPDCFSRSKSVHFMIPRECKETDVPDGDDWRVPLDID